eukprot:gnl/Hemi2/14947_TR5059_c0_g2_i1.p1 gnl/Hemi2/14947_TR5059_c0_g2~~gnl/Hemi2/14947_TR5059_c0_g2_i1.p1  ORF type:complete len:209 (+),score=115.94 gnl/Hemi2/14947_TR5059_c0_g2_i1:126-752(+)
MQRLEQEAKLAAEKAAAAERVLQEERLALQRELLAEQQRAEQQRLAEQQQREAAQLAAQHQQQQQRDAQLAAQQQQQQQASKMRADSSDDSDDQARKPAPAFSNLKNGVFTEIEVLRAHSKEDLVRRVRDLEAKVIKYKATVQQLKDGATLDHVTDQIEGSPAKKDQLLRSLIQERHWLHRRLKLAEEEKLKTKPISQIAAIKKKGAM